MHKLVILGVFALLSASKGDVKHVLDGSAQLPPCYQDHQHYHHTASQSENAVVPGSVAFWWADQDSPFKQAYEYFKKCSSKSDCLPPVAPSFQVPISVPKATNDIESSKANFDKNPFLNGQIKDVGHHVAEKLDLSRNPFLNTGMQAAYSSTGQAVTTGSEGFLGVQPAVPFGSGIKAQPFAVSHPDDGNQQKPSFGSQHPIGSGQPFPSNYPSCVGGERVCVPSQLCTNGIVNQKDVVAQKLSNGHCETGKEECCRFSSGTTYTDSASFESSSSFASSSHSSFANLSSQIANGKTSSSDSLIKFHGGAGLSPGSIQIISDDEPIPNPLLTSGVKGGSAPVNKIKVIRNTYNNNAAKPVFASTIDYTNDKLDDLSFDAAFQGPQYLPPVEGTPPHLSYTPELNPPSYTYQPSIPTTYRPQITVQHSSNGQQQYQPSTFRPQYTQSTKKPTATNEYLPPYSTFKPSQPPINTVHIPTDTKVNSQYVSPTITNTPPHVIYTRPTIATSPKPFVSHPTPGYQYPEPSPPFSYPKPSTNKPVKGGSNVNNQYASRPTTHQQPSSVRPPTPGYSYPTPTPTFGYPSPQPIFKPPSSFKPFAPSPSPTPTFGHPSPQPTFKPPSSFKPFAPSPSPTFAHPSPQPTFKPPSSFKPFSPSPFKPAQTINNNFITAQPVKNGYSYPTPHPPFTYSPESSNIGAVYHPKPGGHSTSNQYLPPRVTTEANLETGASGTGAVFRPPPNHPKPSPNEPIGSVVSPYGGCAAALKCVQEIYCTVEGMISPTPVVLTKEQEYQRVPTTECFDRQAGIVGKCCRDPFYVDPWPSANLVNGVDDGQYREDPRLGQYFAQKPRPVRSGATRGAPVEKCGVRNPNIAPRGESPIDANFAEIPWQAMVLRDTNRSLLCGGAIVKPNAVLTAAHCVEGLDTRDILVKGGEWKLGIDEEPLPFQIVKVAAVIRHPAYTPGSLQNDLALLMLDERLRTAKNIAPICLPSVNQQPSGHCITTGWGKRILQLHLRGAIMRSIDINLMDSNTCTQRLQSKYQGVLPDFSESVICADSNNDHCDVDYGSAMACTNGNGQYTLAGIFSWETGCKDKDQIGGYIPPDTQWIETTCAKPLRELKALDKQYHQ